MVHLSPCTELNITLSALRMSVILVLLRQSYNRLIQKSLNGVKSSNYILMTYRMNF